MRRFFQEGSTGRPLSVGAGRAACDAMERELSNGRLLEGGALPASGRMAAQLRVTDVDKLQKPFFATRRCGQ